MSGHTPQDSPAADNNDGSLIQRAGRGDHAALEDLAGRYERMLLGLALGLLGGREDLARDVVQDVWMRVLRSGARFGGQSSAKTWLYRVTINRCHDVREKADRRLTDQARRDLAAGPASRTFDAEATGKVAAAVEKLKPEARMLVILCYQSGMSHSQAADVLGVPIGTVKSRLSAALGELRAMLNEPGSVMSVVGRSA